jgi:hypothetical protein
MKSPPRPGSCPAGRRCRRPAATAATVDSLLSRAAAHAGADRAAGAADHRPEFAAAGGIPKIDRTEIASDAEAQLFADARKISWGRYAKVKGAKYGDVSVIRQGNVWVVKGRIDSVAPGSEGDWASVDGVVEKIAPGVVQIRGEVAFRVAKVAKGTPCKVAGVLNFKRSGKSQVWRLAEGDNPCDGMREGFDLVYEKPVEKKPVPAQPKRS